MVIVAHGGINPLLVANLIGISPQEAAASIAQSNDEVYRIEISRNGIPTIWKLIPRNKLNEL